MASQRDGVRRNVTAWRPPIPGVLEVFHARFTEYAYPMHVHEAWTLLIVDAGAVRYDLARHEHGTPHDTVSLLPPHVAHNGSPATPDGFRKRVLYLDFSQLGEDLIGPAVDGPDLRDPVLRRRVAQLHTALALARRRAGGGEPAGVRRRAAARPSAPPRGAPGPPGPRTRPATARTARPSASSRASPWRRPPACCRPTRRIWYARSAARTASPRTST
ncbi:hypothetical protein SFUMM280S_05259 [Streptomyces fumanus]